MMDERYLVTVYQFDTWDETVINPSLVALVLRMEQGDEGDTRQMLERALPAALSLAIRENPGRAYLAMLATEDADVTLEAVRVIYPRRVPDSYTPHLGWTLYFEPR